MELVKELSLQGHHTNDPRYLPVDSTTALCKALIAARSEPSALVSMRACAMAYQTGAAPYLGQYIPHLSSLPLPWSVLGSVAAQTFGERTFSGASALEPALTELFGESPSALAAGNTLDGVVRRCTDSYVCLLVLAMTAGPEVKALVAALRLLSLVERAANMGTQPLSEHAIVAMQRAHVVLPTQIFPLPQDREDPEITSND
jgi:hypothetical protein